MTTPGMPAPDGAYQLGQGGGTYKYGQDYDETNISQITRGKVLPKFQNAQNGYKTQYNDPIDNHDNQINELRAEVDTLTIHGSARTLSGTGQFMATPGTVRAELIMIAGGAGGGAGRWDALLAGNRHGGYGGGGGGEVHFIINGAALFEPGTDTPRVIQYSIGAGGDGASANEGNGWGGGNTYFDGITAYGGQGGTRGGGSGGGTGGFGLVNGGSSTGDPDSLSPVELYGGGGAGGRGNGGNAGGGSAGGRGGLNAGGSAGGGNAPLAPLITATGGGGGGGGAFGGRGGAGSAPGGGGGGGGGGTNSGNWGPGGIGAQGIIFVIERAV